MSTTLDFVRAYRQRGWSTLPLLPKDKRPALSSWTEFQHRLPTDEEIAEWFSDDEMNVGIVTGSISKLLLLDADDQNATDGLHLPPTPTVKTGRGFHYYYSFAERYDIWQFREARRP